MLISGQKALKERVSKIEKLLQDNDSKDNQVEKTKKFIEIFTHELISKTNIYTVYCKFTLTILIIKLLRKLFQRLQNPPKYVNISDIRRNERND